MTIRLSLRKDNFPTSGNSYGNHRREAVFYIKETRKRSQMKEKYVVKMDEGAPALDIPAWRATRAVNQLITQGMSPKQAKRQSKVFMEKAWAGLKQKDSNELTRCHSALRVLNETCRQIWRNHQPITIQPGWAKDEDGQKTLGFVLPESNPATVFLVEPSVPTLAHEVGHLLQDRGWLGKGRPKPDLDCNSVPDEFEKGFMEIFNETADLESQCAKCISLIREYGGNR